MVCVHLGTTDSGKSRKGIISEETYIRLFKSRLNAHPGVLSTGVTFFCGNDGGAEGSPPRHSRQAKREPKSRTPWQLLPFLFLSSKFEHENNECDP